MSLRRRHPIAHLLRHLSTLMLRRARLVILLSGLVAVVSLAPIVTRLGINTDTSKMIAEETEWKIAEREMEREFPERGESILIVIDAGTPEIAARVQERLEAALAGRGELFKGVEEAPDPFFVSHGLLYLDTPELSHLEASLGRGGPALGTLARHPSISSFVQLLSGALAAPDRAEGFGAGGVLAGLARGAEAAGRGEVREMSWSGFGPSAGGGDRPRRMLVAWPVLNHSRGFPAEPAIQAIREAAAQIHVDDERGFMVRLTGAAVLNTDELESAARGAGTATVIALAGVLIALYVGLASFRLVLASGLTLLAGLVGTAAFAALAIGELNLISIAFAVLYVGLGIDYAIHVCLRYRESCVAGASHARATLVALRETASSLTICAVTTSVGFFAFIPTAFRGVSELGLIAGVGMFISLIASLTLLPALLFVLGRPMRYKRVEEGAAVDRLIDLPHRWRWAVRAAALVVAVGAVAYALPRVEFDRNRMNLQDPSLESVATYRDLLATSPTPPSTLSVIAADDVEAARMRAGLEALESVRSVVGIDSLIPADQDEKLAILGRLRERVGDALAVGVRRDVAPDPEMELVALEGLAESLRLTAEGDSDAAEAARNALAPVDSLSKELSRRWSEGDEEGVRRSLDAFRESIYGGLATTLGSLRVMLGAERITRESLPSQIADRWIAPDGRLRLEIIPAEDLSGNEALGRFVREVDSVTPRAVGSAAGTLRAGDVMVSAFTQALATALVAIFLIVAVMLRRAWDAWLVMAPLVLAGLLTALASVVLDQPFNFANMIALPLMLGVGVDSGIHIVHRWKTMPAGEPVLASSTARAVLFSSLTTIFSFGTLALSSHRGMKSMGTLLTIAMAVVLLCTLVVLPALLPDGQGKRRAQRR
ncbi:MAG: MMPL family transporter [Phycisphaerales bacterium]